LVPDAARLLAAFDVLVLSSRTEGTPMILLEAMAAGVPVVSFAVGGVPNVLSDTTGWLVPPGDLAALQEAVRQALQSEPSAASRAAAARRRVAERFGLEAWLDRVEQIYGEVDRVRR
jgi:glycosyltransferase involved in cell wall biosynthesis